MTGGGVDEISDGAEDESSIIMTACLRLAPEVIDSEREVGWLSRWVRMSGVGGDSLRCFRWWGNAGREEDGDGVGG